jgi:hypothetical protein
MPKTEITTTQKTAVVLAPVAAAHLSATLDTLKELKVQMEAIQHLMEIERLTVQQYMVEAGVDKMQVDGLNLAIVRGVTSTLDKKKLLALGVTAAQLEMATTTTPKKPYLSIRESAGTTPANSPER